MNIFNYFKKSVDQYPDKTCLVIDKKEYTFSQLNDFTAQIAHILNQHTDLQYVGVFCRKSLSTYAGILASLTQCKTYIPFNNKFPADRNQMIIDMTETGLFILDEKNIKQFEQLELREDTIVITPEISKNDLPESISSKYKCYTSEDLGEKNYNVCTPSDDILSYIIFTSGSTGTPKGVSMVHSNVVAYIDNIHKLYKYTKEDRFSQAYEITFDPSLHDMFVCWGVGATLYTVPDSATFLPAKFIKENEITAWFSVPSVAQFMNKFRLLKENAFPSLKHSVFCAEPLSTQIVEAWRKAAPNTIVSNLYGPTETTVIVTTYDVHPDDTDIAEKYGIVSLGKIFEDQEFLLIDDEGKPSDTKGEMYIKGSQVSKGYFKNEKKTSEHFVYREGDDALYYRTGDILEQKDGNLFFVERKDFQVKIRGNRIELDEINHYVSSYTKGNFVVTIPYPINEGIATDLYTFIDSGVKNDKSDIIDHLTEKLPNYMVPKDIIKLDNIPLNSNGKVDRKELAKILAKG